MKIFLTLLLSFILGFNLAGQSVDYQAVIDDYFKVISVKSSRQGNFYFKVIDGHKDRLSGHHFVYVHEYLNGVRVRKEVTSVVLDEDGVVIYGKLKDSSATEKAKIDAPTSKLSAKKALSISLTELEVKEVTDLIQLKNSGNKLRFKSQELSDEIITSELVYVKLDGYYRICWETSIFIEQYSEWWQVRIDAQTGGFVDKNTWTLNCFHESGEHNNESCRTHSQPHFSSSSVFTEALSCDSSYNVFDLPAEHPEDGVRSLISKPWLLAPIASPQGWHTSAITQGNNVFAYEDTGANNLPGRSADGGMDLCFDFPLDLTKEPDNYENAAITNLFFVSNKVHDIMYRYGFDEAAGNFQQENYTDLGEDDDYVLAETQDGSGFNNANFSTPPDGIRPRMQMFNWILANRLFSINEPSSISGDFMSSGATFGPQSFSITGTVAEAEPADGCSDLSNPTDLVGKIALMDRGGCLYVDKVLRAQAAGAIALIVCQYDSLSTLVTMGGDTSAQINIPTVMVSGQVCDTIRMSLDTSDVEVSFRSPISRDSDLDNVVIIHEYAHGISVRLTAGPSTSDCLDNEEQMGEGWSDWYALMLTMKSSDISTEPRGIGTYLEGEPNDGTGIRQYPYSTDLTTNPAHYNTLPNAFIPHGVGQVWASMLWEVTWELIGEYGFDADIYYGQGGNNIALELVTMGLKIQPCSPGFVDGRDAILEADKILYGGIHQCMIWKAFAKRGLGYTADQGSVNSRSDGSAASDLPPSCTLDFVVDFTSDKRVVSIEDSIEFDIVITGYQEMPTEDLVVCDSLGIELGLIAGTLSYGMFSNNKISYTDINFAEDSVVRVNYQSQLESNAELSELVYYEGVESGQGLWTIEANGENPWQVSTQVPYQGQNSFFAPGNIGNQDHFLISPTISLTQDQLFSFWHSYDMESNWDGGFVELQVVGTSEWIDLGVYFVQNGYDDRLINSSNPLTEERMAFTGNSGGYIRSWIDLSAYIGLDVRVRFYYGSDAFASGDGWHIDDIALYKAMYTDNVLTTQFGSSITRDTLKVYKVPACLPCQGDIVCEDEVLILESIGKSTYRAGSGIVLNNVGSTGSGTQLFARDSVVIYPMLEVKKDSILIIQIEDCIDP